MSCCKLSAYPYHLLFCPVGELGNVKIHTWIPSLIFFVVLHIVNKYRESELLLFIRCVRFSITKRLEILICSP